MHMETNKETMKITSNSRIYKAIYHYSSYILLFGKKKLKNFNFHTNNISYFEMRVSPFQEPQSNKSCTLIKLQN